MRFSPAGGEDSLQGALSGRHSLTADNQLLGLRLLSSLGAAAALHDRDGALPDGERRPAAAGAGWGRVAGLLPARGAAPAPGGAGGGGAGAPARRGPGAARPGSARAPPPRGGARPR